MNILKTNKKPKLTSLAILEKLEKVVNRKMIEECFMNSLMYDKKLQKLADNLKEKGFTIIPIEHITAPYDGRSRSIFIAGVLSDQIRITYSIGSSYMIMAYLHEKQNLKAEHYRRLV